MLPVPPAPEFPPLIPSPVTAAIPQDAPPFRFGPRTVVVVSGTAQATGKMLAEWLHLARPRNSNGPATKDGTITVSVEPGLKGEDGAPIPAEGYRLTVAEDGVAIVGADAAGAFYGAQTLRQLLPPASFDPKAKAVATPIAAIRIEDYPRFSWRGQHLDVVRHFLPKADVLRFLDAMALHKLNTFHFHLTDDQGWRIEIKRYPKLTRIGGFRKDTMLTYDPPTYDGKPHGGFYTQREIREIVAYAAARHITVVPEIEMPGHAQAALAAYPELGNLDATGGAKVETGTKWGVIYDVFNAEDSTVTFLQNVLAEVLPLFPSRFIHVGGDEVPKEQWKASPSAQAKIRRLGLKDEHELQSWFIRQMDAWLAARGRRLLGWDEILEGGLAPGAAVMSWRGPEGGIAAAKAGHDVVMSDNGYLYFDAYQSEDRTKEPHAIGGYLPWEKVYALEPIPAALTPEEGRHILGAQGQLWTEYISGLAHVEYMTFPRVCALSEVLWSHPETRDVAVFRARLATHLERLRAMGVNFRPLD